MGVNNKDVDIIFTLIGNIQAICLFIKIQPVVYK